MLEAIWRNMPDVVKNLLLLNIIMFLIAITYGSNGYGFELNWDLGLYYAGNSESFQPYQIISHMFMHGNFGHLFFNMFAMVMFGGQLERIWGAKRFLLFYFITGFGAVLLHQFVQGIQVYNITGQFFPDMETLTTANYSIDEIKALGSVYAIPTVGASGAIYGLLMGFAMLFPNTELMLLFFPVPVKAKYFVPLLMVGEFFMGMNNFAGDNVAHFAHLGGALFGLIIILIWKRNRNNFY